MHIRRTEGPGLWQRRLVAWRTILLGQFEVFVSHGKQKMEERQHKGCLSLTKTSLKLCWVAVMGRESKIDGCLESECLWGRGG